MKKVVIAAAAMFAATTFAHAEGFAEGDAAKGEKVFKKCAACHAVGDGAKNKVGPQLNGIVGRDIAGVEDYKYGDAIKAKGEELGAWTEEMLFEYLVDPKKFVEGRSKMTFKLRKDGERNDVIAYLKTYGE